MAGALGCTVLPTGSVRESQRIAIPENDAPQPAIILLDENKTGNRTDVETAVDGPLTLEACVQQALTQHPDLALAAAQVESARGQLLQAGLYPNPTVGYSAQEINSPGGEAGQQGITLSQTLVTGNKLGLSSASAAREVEATDWRSRARYFDVVTRVRSAFFEALTARQEVEVAREMLRIAQSGLETAEKLKEGRVVEQPDVLRARVESQQSQIRLTVAEQRAAAAERLLAVSMGHSELSSLSLSGTLTSGIPEYELASLRNVVVEVSAEVRANRSEILRAEANLARAEAEVTPDLEFQVNPFYSAPDQRMQVGLSISAALPLFNRNQGNIAAARAGIAQAHAELRRTELQLLERVTQSFQRYQNARTQVRAYEDRIVPAAQESVRLLAIAYGQGSDQRYDFTALLEAQRSLAQAKLGLVQALGELQKAVSEIEGMLQRLPDQPAPSLPVR